MADIRRHTGGVEESVSITSQVLGYFVPGAQFVHDVIQHYQERRRRKVTERIKRFVETLDARLARLERDPPSEEEVDLFEKILEAAVREEDQAKSPYYVALVEYYMKERVDPPIVRLLANSFKALSAWELMILRKLHKGGQKVFFRSDVLGQSVFLRLEGLGLYDGKQTHPRKVTPLGKMLREVIELADEAHPDTP